MVSLEQFGLFSLITCASTVTDVYKYMLGAHPLDLSQIQRAYCSKKFFTFMKE
jgi:hypothetical protein